jgi:hypothetical protein
MVEISPKILITILFQLGLATKNENNFDGFNVFTIIFRVDERKIKEPVIFIFLYFLFFILCFQDHLESGQLPGQF